MILVAIRTKVLAEKRKELSQTIASLIGSLRAEKGCRRCDFYRSMENENELCIIEEWDTRKNLNSHLKCDMPIMDGWSLTHCIKERSPNTPVVLMTGGDRETVWKKVERGSVDSVIFKPFRLDNLQRTVQGVLAFTEKEHGSVGVG